MPALISWVCRVEHAVQERNEYLAMITIHKGTWAYCVRGGAGRHRWDAIEPAPVELLALARRSSPQAGEESTSRRAG